jgi:hypothetical protein
MPTRLVRVTPINNSEFPIIWQDDGRSRWFSAGALLAVEIAALKKGKKTSWRQESGGIARGVEVWLRFKVNVPFAGNVDVRTGGRRGCSFADK